MNRELSRRRLLRSVAVGAAAGLAGCSTAVDAPAGTTDEPGSGSSPSSESGTAQGSTATDARTPADPTPPGRVRLETLATGLGAPLDVAFAPDADRRYVADQAGRILVHERDGVRSRPALDIRDRIEAGGEKGLLGIALHPSFAENRRLFVRYSAPSREATPQGYSHTFVLSEFTVGNGRRVDPDSERTLLEIPQPQSNHNAGDLAFGPDGFLYVAVGDGGAGGDQGTGHVDDWYSAVDGGNGQDVTTNLLGSILRIDVDSEGAEGRAYAIPADNPLVGREGLDEQYAWGFRNPWRMSFDEGRLFVGDVGQNSFEEVSLVERGGNYGWNVREGTHCYRADDCPTATPDGDPLVDPIVEYPHSGGGVSGISVIGGAVYRGSALPAANGVYVFGDFQVQGRLFAATPPADGGPWPTTTVELAGDGGDRLRQLRSFGRDADGELYVVGRGADGGGLYRLAPADGA
jgi:glucose/arabinose dehydrogenase